MKFESFEIAVREAKPWTIMTAYNPVNGVEATENYSLLQGVLRDQWGFAGCVISDWGAVHDRLASLLAGMNLEMPSSGSYNRDKIVAAVNNGQLPLSRLDQMVRQLLAVVLEATARRSADIICDNAAHNDIARRVSADCIVLLKNQGNLLPIDLISSKKLARVALIGSYAKAPRIQGGGSSQVRPTMVTSAMEEFARAHPSIDFSYAPGYEETNGQTSDQLLDQARGAAREADLAIVFVGLPDDIESEAFDRSSMSLPDGHNQLVAAVAEVQRDVALVLIAGSAVEMPWVNSVKSILLAGLGGQAGGAAMVDVLTGAVNPIVG